MFNFWDFPILLIQSIVLMIPKSTSGQLYLRLQYSLPERKCCKKKKRKKAENLESEAPGSNLVRPLIIYASNKTLKTNCQGFSHGSAISG